jgi:hypothetical protein
MLFRGIPLVSENGKKRFRNFCEKIQSYNVNTCGSVVGTALKFGEDLALGDFMMLYEQSRLRSVDRRLSNGRKLSVILPGTQDSLL